MSLDTIRGLLSSSSNDDNGFDLITKDKKELIDYLAEEWYYSKDEAFDLVKGMDISQEVLLGSVSYHDEALNHLVYSNPTEIKVIHNFG